MPEGDGLSGNKGEWSEYYAFLKILADGRIHGADSEMNIDPKIVYDISRIYRVEKGKRMEFSIDGEEQTIFIFREGEAVASISIKDFQDEYAKLYIRIKDGEGSFTIPETVQFMNLIGVEKLKANSGEKADITIQIHEPWSGLDLKQGFSIKSLIGEPATLINSSKSTNFVYELKGEITESILKEADEIINSERNDKVRAVMRLLIENNISLDYIGTRKPTLTMNLRLIDSELPKIVASMLHLYYSEGVTFLKDSVERVGKLNPIGYPDLEMPYYRYKVKKMLAAYALGMKSAYRWDGKEDANGGYIVVREDGEVVCYHIFDRDNFEEYLLCNTKFDTPSTGKFDFGRIYREGDSYRINLNIQVRFIK